MKNIFKNEVKFEHSLIHAMVVYNGFLSQFESLNEFESLYHDTVYGVSYVSNESEVKSINFCGEVTV